MDKSEQKVVDDINKTRWNELHDAYGAADKIPKLLKDLSLNTKPREDYKEEPWFSLWSALCHQGDVYTASYAAVPHIIEIALESKGEIDPSFFFLPREIMLCFVAGRGPQIPSEVYPSYVESILKLGQVKTRIKNYERKESDSTTMDDEKGLCKQCGHPFDPHMLVAVHGGDPTKGGVMFCPEEGCPCFNTWDFAQKSAPPNA